MKVHPLLTFGSLMLLMGALGCTASDSASTNPTLAEPSPAPVASAVGKAPVRCDGPAPTAMRFGSAIGVDPVWAIGFGGDEATLRLLNGPRTRYGWRVKVLVVARMPVPQDLSLEIRRVPDQAAAWIAPGGGKPRPHPLLTEPPVPPVGDWAQFPSHVFLPSEGCFEMTARWHEGAWTIPFAFGR